MVAERRHIDLEDDPDLASVVELATRSHEPIEVRRSGHLVAFVRPAEGVIEEIAPTEEGLKRLMATAGTLKDVIPEDYVAELHRMRERRSRRRIPSL